MWRGATGPGGEAVEAVGGIHPVCTLEVLEIDVRTVPWWHRRPLPHGCRRADDADHCVAAVPTTYVETVASSKFAHRTMIAAHRGVQRRRRLEDPPVLAAVSLVDAFRGCWTWRKKTGRGCSVRRWSSATGSPPAPRSTHPRRSTDCSTGLPKVLPADHHDRAPSADQQGLRRQARAVLGRAARR